MSMFMHNKSVMPSPEEALPGREQPMPVAATHFVNGNPMTPPFPANMQQIILGLGCFWGAERKFWELDGVYTTAVGYSASYQEVCSGQTGHNEVVLVVYDPAIIRFEELLRVFWESHDPTQGMRQGNDAGTQYRSGIYTFDDEQQKLAEISRAMYQQELGGAGYGAITTEIKSAGDFYYAEDYHQQYLARNPGGYCGLGGTGVSCPAGNEK
jgi:peptide-methionine (S)-S-oxide reductase